MLSEILQDPVSFSKGLNGLNEDNQFPANKVEGSQFPFLFPSPTSFSMLFPLKKVGVLSDLID